MSWHLNSTIFVLRGRIMLLSLGIVLLLTSCFGGDKPEQAQQHARGGVNAASLSIDGRYALVASVYHSMGLWDNQKQGLLYSWTHGQNSPANIVAVALSASGQRALTAEEHNVVLWDVSSGKSLQFWQIPYQILCVALDKQGRYALIGFRTGHAELIDLQTGQTLRQFPHDDNVSSVSLSLNGKYALTGSDDHTAKLWDVASGRLLQTWQHQKKVTTVVLSPNNNFALTAASQANVKIWDIRSGKMLHQLNTAPITVSAARFSPSENLVAAGSIPQHLDIWDVRTGKHVQRKNLPRGSYWKPTSTIIYALAFSADEQSIWTEDSLGYGYRWVLD